MDRSRASTVYKAYKQKENQVLESMQCRLLQKRVQELELENRILKKLLDEKNK